LVEKGNSPSADPRRDFLNRFFHDLATPLSAVALHLEGADRRVQRGGDPSESLKTARSELSRAFELFELARECLIGPGQANQPWLFDDLVAAAVKKSAAPDVLVAGSTAGRAAGDGGTIERALQDLVANAVEASGAEAVAVRVERAGGNLRVVVENPGSLSADPESLFSPRVAGPGRRWGMGLPRARLFAAAAGGTVRLEQNSGRVSAILELPEEQP
jgi:signal transduction histidine kinase